MIDRVQGFQSIFETHTANYACAEVLQGGHMHKRVSDVSVSLLPKWTGGKLACGCRPQIHQCQGLPSDLRTQ